MIDKRMIIVDRKSLFDPNLPNADGANTPEALLNALVIIRTYGPRAWSILDDMAAYFGEAIDGGLLSPVTEARFGALREHIESAMEEISAVGDEVEAIDDLPRQH